MDLVPPTLTPSGPEPAPPTGRSRAGATVASVIALVIGAIATAGLLLLAAALSLCNLWGETCTPAEEQQISLVVVLAGASFLGVPALVAIVRRDARWLSAPLIEVIVVVAIAIGATIA